VTEDNLKSAAVLDHQNELNEALAWSKNRYRQIFLGVDWGGGGVKEVSRTVVAVIGIRPGGKYETPYIEEFLASSEGHEQAARVLDLFSMFGATHIGHDYGGAGQNREDLLIQFGFPIDRLVPLAYVRATAQPMITTRSADGHGSRSYYAYDKTRSLLTLAEMIKTRLITFPQYQSCEALLKQFLALQNETTTPKRGGAFNLVTTPPDTPDDVPQAINFGLGAAYRVMDEYPNLAVAHQSTLSKVNLRIATPQSPVQQVYSDFAASDLGYRV
jgi:hypothetical protein